MIVEVVVTLAVSKLSGLVVPGIPTVSRLADRSQTCYFRYTVLNFNYDPLQVDAKTAQADMIAGHIWTVFSIPQNRSYIDSGYPSEPILAVAALRICDNIEKQNGHTKIDLFATMLQDEMLMCSVDSAQREDSSHSSVHGRCCQGATKQGIWIR